jgi:hypothetical protein
MNRRIRNRTYGGVGGRRARALLLPDLSMKMVYVFIPVACLNIIGYDAIFYSWNFRDTLIRCLRKG